MPLTRPLILGIETSCDDTACALVDGSGAVLTSVVSSQLELHREYGGVVPELASREHLTNWRPVCNEALADAGLSLEDIDVVAATHGPGLIGSLLVGLSLAKSIAFALSKPFFAVHHLEGHLYSPYLSDEGEAARPLPEEFVGLVVSGGHTSLFEVVGSDITRVANTRDDAFGEVFDKVGKRLGLDYPQGPIVDRLAEKGTVQKGLLRVARCSDGELDFSYSGLKSQTLLEFERLDRTGTRTRDLRPDDVPQPVLDVLASFRRTAVDQILDRLARHHRASSFARLAVSGGAAANRLLRSELQQWATERRVALDLVPLAFAGDNAAMIAHAARGRARAGASDDPRTTRASSRVSIG